MIKIAFLILAHNNFDHLERLICTLDDKHVRIFIHIDKKSTMPSWRDKYPQLVFVERVSVWWAGFSQQEAINILINKAIECNADYYLLLSGADYPIRDKSFLIKKLAAGGQYINIMKGFLDHKPEKRIKYYYFDGFNRKNKNSIRTLLFYSLEMFLRMTGGFQKKEYPFPNIYHGSTWWALSHKCLEYIVSYIRHNSDFVDFFRSSLCPDESFIHTIVGNSTFFKECKYSLTFTDWAAGQSSPAIINPHHINKFESQRKFTGAYGEYEPYFARKFTNQSKEIVEIIERVIKP